MTSLFPIYLVTLTDGHPLSGEIQGNGGTCNNDRRVAGLMRDRLKEAVLRDTIPDGQWIQTYQREHAGLLSIWTDPDGACCDRLTTVDIGDVMEVRNADTMDLVYRASPRESA